MNGALVLDKPQGITSHDAVAAVRRLLSEPRIGHLGTLDPFATGVLVLLLGKATRLARFYREREKTYEGVVRFGYSTTTFDATGEPTSPPGAPKLEAGIVEPLLSELTGTRLQQPPAFSAKKVAGVPAYRLARKGQEVQLTAVPVTVHAFTLLGVEGACARFRATVSSGTYIRSLAQELGERTGLGAHLAELRRTAVGEFGERNAMDLPRLADRVREGNVPVIPMEALLPEFPAVSLAAGEVKAASHGNRLRIESDAKWLKLLGEAGELFAIAEQAGEHCYHPVMVLGGGLPGKEHPVPSAAPSAAPSGKSL